MSLRRSSFTLCLLLVLHKLHGDGFTAFNVTAFSYRESNFFIWRVSTRMNGWPSVTDININDQSRKEDVSLDDVGCLSVSIFSAHLNTEHCSSWARPGTALITILESRSWLLSGHSDCPIRSALFGEFWRPIASSVGDFGCWFLWRATRTSGWLSSAAGWSALELIPFNNQPQRGRFNCTLAGCCSLHFADKRIALFPSCSSLSLCGLDTAWPRLFPIPYRELLLFLGIDSSGGWWCLTDKGTNRNNTRVLQGREVLINIMMWWLADDRRRRNYDC